MYKVGEYTDVLADVKGMDTSGVVALVVSSDEGTGMNIKGISMRDKLQEIFMKRPVQRSKTVCFNAYLQPEIVDVVKNTIEATIQFAENGTRSQIEELFVCCMKGHKEVLQKIDKIFQLKRGYCREIHTNDANIWENKEPTLNVIVRLGSLHEVKADVLVNTTNKDLILTRGKVSQELLTLAGTSLLDQCKNKYPDGIRNGEIAVTDSHNLRERGFKFIYHAALLDYSYETFQQNIKLYVKLCLCQAERNECSRIAFPAFGVGKLRYPRRETAAAMFEAIDEFCEEALNPKLNKVKLVVHESDDKTCQAFANEEWRHSKACVKEIGETKQHIASDFRALELETKLLSIRIATQEDFGIPKSYAVEIFFGQGKRGLKQASEKPRTWNDQIGLDYIKDKSQMTDNVLWTLALLVEERVTEPVFYTNTDNATPLSEGEQVKAILDGLKTQTDTRFPKKVIIVVSDESGLHNVAQMLNIEEQLASDWTNNNSEGHRISFELIGKTKASLDGAETFVKDFVKKIKEESALEAVKRHSVKIKTEAVNASFEATDKDELEETYEVTAELNPGIVRFKKKSNDWDNWRVKVEEKFNVKIFCSEDAVKVGGMFHDILELENYLESSSALDDPIMSDGMFDSSGKSLVPMPLNEDHFGQIHHSPILVRMSETEYQAFMLLCKLEETTNEEKNIRICYDITAHGMLISTSRNIPTVKQQVERELQILKNNERHIQIQSETDLTLATQAIEKVQEEMKVFCCITSNNQDVMITGLHFDEVEKASCLISQSLQLPVPD
ncbi:uncharacterized protein LOC128554359, partial [Mercenaria mercenaria]|uniref:uncharacterized protein LOC128554359 n=1 Tax=Mercenaria mercenaria TaxID=6596 RepID=UPI00234FA32D